MFSCGAARLADDGAGGRRWDSGLTSRCTDALSETTTGSNDATADASDGHGDASGADAATR